MNHLRSNRRHQQSDTVYSLYYSATKQPKPIEVSVTHSNDEATMEVETGATLLIMSKETYSGTGMLDPHSFPLLLSSSLTQVRKSLFLVQFKWLFSITTCIKNSSLSQVLDPPCSDVTGCSTFTWTGQGSTYSTPIQTNALTRCWPSTL